MGYVKIGGGLGEKTGRENLLSALAGLLFASSPSESWLLLEVEEGDREGEEEEDGKGEEEGEEEVGGKGGSNARADRTDVGLLMLSVQYINELPLSLLSSLSSPSLLFLFSFAFIF